MADSDEHTAASPHGRPRATTTSSTTSPTGVINELIRRASIAIMDTNPQLGMWQATGTAIAQAPNLSELRGTESGGVNIEFNSQGHSARIVEEEPDGEIVLAQQDTLAGVRRRNSIFGSVGGNAAAVGEGGLQRRNTRGSVLADVTEGIPSASFNTSPTTAATASSSRRDSKQIGPDEIMDGADDDNTHTVDGRRKGPAEARKHGHHHHFRRGPLRRRQTLKDKHKHERLEKWGPTIKNGLLAFWKFFITPAGFLITIYGLNIVAWGAMLFFLLLNAAPAMAVPNADDDNSPRKIWLEIDSQILNALFCVTGFGLAPWRFRDLYWFIRATRFRDGEAMRRLAKQNKGWFRPPRWAVEDGQDGTGLEGGMTGVSTAERERQEGGRKYSGVPAADPEHEDLELGPRNEDVHGGVRHDDDDPDFVPRQPIRSMTFTGQTAPPTPLWKLFFTIMMMVLNTALQAVLCYFMWGYNRFNRPSWATGLFIGLGCATGMFSGLMSWWEGRKVKKIEGPEVQIVEKEAEVASV